MSTKRFAVTLACTAILAACASAPDDVERIRDLTGLFPPTETGEAQSARVPNILSRVDSLALSTLRWETDNLELPRWHCKVQCVGAQCSIYSPQSGDSLTVSVADFAPSEGTSEAIGSRHGITLVSASGQAEGVELTSYGAWIEHRGSASIRRRPHARN